MLKTLEDNLVEIAGAILVLPIIIFCFGFLKLYVAIIISGIVIFSYYRLIKKLPKNNHILYGGSDIISCVAYILWYR